MRVKIAEKNRFSFVVKGKITLKDARGNSVEIKNKNFTILSGMKKAYDFKYFALFLKTHDRNEADGFLKAYAREGFDLMLKEVKIGALKPMYFIYDGPYLSKKELTKHAPANILKIFKVSEDNKAIPMYFKIDGKTYTLYGKLHIKTQGFITLLDVAYSKGLSSEFRKNVVLDVDITVFPARSGKLCMVAEIPIDEYLLGVVSSEIGNRAPLEAKKAQAVAARTNVIRKILENPDFSDYDVTSDVYAQVYSGMALFSPDIERAVNETRGEVITFDGEPIDALFHAMCGGHTENSENIWSSYLPYLRGVLDRKDVHRSFSLRSDVAVRKWINANPDVNCRKYGKKYWRWSFSYTPRELGHIIKLKTGRDIGSVVKMTVLERGVSGRVKRIKLKGTLGSIVVQKDLNIRKSLAFKSLPSSLFYVSKKGGRFVITGRGFGHGVGMCQIGAMGMADRGYNYKKILKHYYSHVRVEKIY